MFISQAHMLIALLILAAPGCGSSAGQDPGDLAETRAVLKVVGIEYGNYLAAHRGTPPRDEQALRSFLESRLKDLDANNVRNVDQLLTSPRDKSPLKFIYGVRIAPPTDPETPWAAYEQTGDGAARLAANIRGAVVEISNDELATQIPLR